MPLTPYSSEGKENKIYISTAVVGNEIVTEVRDTAAVFHLKISSVFLIHSLHQT